MELMRAITKDDSDKILNGQGHLQGVVVKPTVATAQHDAPSSHCWDFHYTNSPQKDMEHKTWSPCNWFGSVMHVTDIAGPLDMHLDTAGNVVAVVTAALLMVPDMRFLRTVVGAAVGLHSQGVG